MHYQLDLISPGISPLMARFLRHILHISNFLKYALGLPQRGHRLYSLTENFGVLFAFAIRDFFATRIPPDIFPFHTSISKRQSHEPQQLSCFFIRPCRCCNHYIHSSYLINLIILYFREDDLFLQSQGEITSPVKRLW